MGSANTATTTHPHPVELAGHLGSLTTEQEAAFAIFKEKLASAKLYIPASEDQKASQSDTTLLRFLRARNFDTSAAQKQFADCEAWRKKHDAPRLFRELTTEDMVHAQRFYPRWTGRRNKLGIPAFVYRLATLEPIIRELDKVSAAERYKRIIALNEYLANFILPLCDSLPRSHSIPISSTMTIIDLEKVSFGSMWRMRGLLQEASRMSTANYPETLYGVAIVNSPSFFPTIWNWIKGWFDEGTRRKIHVLGNDPGSTLRELIDPQHLPVKYGGELGWEFGDSPSLDEDAKNLIGEMPLGPAIFVDGKVIQPPPP